MFFKFIILFLFPLLNEGKIIVENKNFNSSMQAISNVLSEIRPHHVTLYTQKKLLKPNDMVHENILKYLNILKECYIS